MLYPVYVFDAYGTLFDVHSAVAHHRAEIGEQAAVLSQIWRTKQLEYTWVRTMAGAYKDFRVLTQDALDFAAVQCGGISDDLRHKLLASYETLDAYADVRATLEGLKQAGARTAILSNGTPAMLEAAISASGLSDVVDACLSVDAIGMFKTRPEAYAMVETHFAIKPAQVSFQSSNRWDIAGAAAFGFRCVWINRTSQPDEYFDLAPMRVLPSLSGLLQDAH